eukprot:Skav219503  [mRNA]  locus=scaffold5760:16264:16587:- [translate_table: standard]
MVGSGRLHDAQLSCLMAGHSHEDVDMFFASIAHVLEAHNELHTPAQFAAVLDHHLQKPDVRPEEPLKFAKLVNTVRDWMPVFHFCNVSLKFDHPVGCVWFIAWMAPS